MKKEKGAAVHFNEGEGLEGRKLDETWKKMLVALRSQNRKGNREVRQRTTEALFELQRKGGVITTRSGVFHDRRKGADLLT